MLLTGTLEHHYYSNATPAVDDYFRGLGVDPEDSRTKALASAGDKPIKSCWDRILTTPEFEEWRRAQDTCILWVVGGPGKGKTILSLGLVDELAHATQHDNGEAFVAYFFCGDMDSTTNAAISILKGLIYGLGQEDRGLMRFLSDKFRAPEDIKGAGIDTLWGILVKILTASSGLGAVYLIVDALDECRDEGEVGDFLDLVRKSSFRRSVKWVFTSRQSPLLCRSLGSGAGVHTIDLDTSKYVERSVDEYLEIVVGMNHQFSGRQKQKVLDLLRSDTDKTFLYVSLVLEDLRMASDADISKWIADLENSVHGESVYRRYRLMLQQVIERDEESGATTLQNLLKAVLLAAETLSLPELAIAAGLPPEFYDPDPESGGQRRTAELVQECGHMLRIAEGKVYLMHKSAKDYLTIGDGVKEGPFLSSSSTEHALISERCLQALDSNLLPTPNLSTVDSLVVRVPSQESRQRMESLRYIYSHWSHHVVQAQASFSSWPLVERFLHTRFLAWVEAMGHMGQIQRCIEIIQALRKAMEGELQTPVASRQNKSLLEDAFQFLIRYRPMIQVHPRQVYLLAKYFTPKNSLIRKNHKHISCCLRIGYNPPADWDPCQYTLDVAGYQWGDKDKRKVTSPRYDRSGFDLAKYYFSFTSRDFRLGFSENGETFSVGSSTLGRNTLSWNVADGSFAGSTDTTEDGLAWSNDGLLSASWSEKGIGVWDVEANKLICHLENSGSSDRRYTAVRFASDGSAIAVAFSESFLFQKTRRTLKLWDARSGFLLREIDLAGEAIRGLSFVPDGHVLAVYFDRALVLHEIRGHKTREVPPKGNISEPNGVAFSDDGNIIVVVTRSLVAFYNAESFDELAKWNVPQNDLGLDQYFRQEDVWTRPKPNLGIEIAVSRDGKIAALGFRDSIAFFRLDERPLRPTYHSTTKYRPVKDENFFQSKLPVIDALRFSPCGSYLACARNDDTISIWNVRASCQALPRQARVPEGLVRLNPYPYGEYENVIVYSPDGKVCGTKIMDHVYLWRVKTATVKLRLKGTPSLGRNFFGRYRALPWVFSPDSRLAITTTDRKMHLVNIQDWEQVEIALSGHVSVLTFNSQGTHFALATFTSPPVVLLYETASRRRLLRYEANCDMIHAMAFSSAGTLMAAGSTSENFLYYVWEGLCHSSPSASRAPRLHKTLRHTDGTRDMRMMRIEFSQDNITAISVICVFWSTVVGIVHSAHAETTTLGDSTIVSRRTELIDEGYVNSGTLLEVEVQGHDSYGVRKRDLVHFQSEQLVVSSRFGPTTGGMTAGGIEIAPPAKQNRNTCKCVEIEQDGKFSWVTWNGQRVLCFPLSISWTRRDPWETCLILTHEPDSVWFMSFEL